MKQSIKEELLDIQHLVKLALEAYEANSEQDVLNIATRIRDGGWSVKSLIFDTRFLDKKISARTMETYRQGVVSTRRTAASLDDLLDLL